MVSHLRGLAHRVLSPCRGRVSSQPHCPGLDVPALRHSRNVWITHSRAAEILECGTTTVQRLIAAGDLHPRKVRGRSASLDQDEVVALAESRAERRVRDEADARRRQRERELGRFPPPDDQHDWLTASQAARVVGFSAMAVYKRVSRQAIPFTEHRGRYWFRRDHMELLSNAVSMRDAKRKS
jgi:hypothetical protein